MLNSLGPAILTSTHNLRWLLVLNDDATYTVNYMALQERVKRGDRDALDFAFLWYRAHVVSKLTK